MIYKTDKVSAAPQYRKVELKYSDIDGADSRKRPLFPTVTVRKKDGNAYKFLVFNRKKFMNRYAELKEAESDRAVSQRHSGAGNR